MAGPPDLKPAGLRVELLMSDLARRPSADEVEAINVAVRAVLGLAFEPPSPGPQHWRFSGRWWQQGASGAPRWARGT
ncbi:MAG TPA: hypothetical protein VME20_09580 [Acidimicrobiales bacterium]|nr:hypothetical protein [Acidimicrobiales bacterium]